MAKHLWTIFCTSSSVDRESNNISLIEVLEEIQITTNNRDDWPTVVPASGHVVSLWARTDPDEGETVEARLRLLGPEGEELLEKFAPIDLSANPRHRVIGRLQGLPLAGTGHHAWEISQRPGADHDWQVEALMPLAVKVEFSEDPTQQPAEDSEAAAT